MVAWRRPAVVLAHLVAGLVVSGSASAQQLVPVNESLGLPTQWGPGYADTGGGVSWADLDGDGLAELVLTSPATLPRLFAGLADGGLQEVPFALLADQLPGFAHGHTVLDIEGDGDLDVLLLMNGTNALLRNEGGLVFSDVSATHLPMLRAPSKSAAAGDLDGDGDTDLVIGNSVRFSTFPSHRCARNHWLFNDGDGHFTERSAAVVVDPPIVGGCTLAVALTDVDGDGDLDVVEANDFGTHVAPSRVWRNDGLADVDGLPRFAEVGAALGLDHRRYGMTVAIGDLNDDGALDHFISSIGRPRLVAGQSDGTFTDVTDPWGTAAMTFGHDAYNVTWDARIADMNGDGFQDLLVVAGYLGGASFFSNDGAPSQLVLASDGPASWTFAPNDWSWPSPDGGIARSMALHDIDDDGDLDLALALTQGDPVIYRNDSVGQTPLRVTLTATTTVDTAGARVWATCAGMTRLRERTAGGATSGTGGVPIQITFPAPCDMPGQAVELLIRWPSGYTQSLTADAGGTVAVTEPDWLVVTPTDVTLSPTLSDGSPAPLKAVAVTASGATVGSLAAQPDGSLVASMSPDAGSSEAVLTVSVGQTVWAAHPRVTFEAAPWNLRLVPQHAVAGRPSTARVTISGAATTAGLSVANGPVQPLAVGADGVWSGELSAWPGDATSVTVSLWLDGAPAAEPLVIEVAPPVSEGHSFLNFAGLDGTTGPSLNVTGRLADINGSAYAVANPDVALLVDGDPVGSNYFEPSTDGSFLASFNTTSFPPGATLQLTYTGHAVGLPQTLWAGIDPPPAPLTLVDPLASYCIVPRPSLRADGEDTSVVLVGLRDTGGSRVQPDAAVTLALEGLTLIETETTVFDDYYRFVVRHVAGASPPPSGTAQWGVTLDGVPSGLLCSVEIIGSGPVPAAGEFGEATMTAADTTIASGSGGPGGEPNATRVTVWPRWPQGRLVGSGLGVVWETSMGTVTDYYYEGFGRYGATLQAGDDTGVATVTATAASGESWSVDVTIMKGTTSPEDDGPEPGADGPIEPMEPSDLAEMAEVDVTMAELNPDAATAESDTDAAAAESDTDAAAAESDTDAAMAEPDANGEITEVYAAEAATAEPAPETKQREVSGGCDAGGPTTTSLRWILAWILVWILVWLRSRRVSLRRCRPGRAWRSSVRTDSKAPSLAPRKQVWAHTRPHKGSI